MGLWIAVMVCGVGSVQWSSVQGAPPTGGEARGHLPADEPDKVLEKRYRDRYKEFVALARGEPHAGEEHKAILETAAKYLTYRLTWTEYSRDRKQGGIEPLIKEFDEQVLAQALKAKENGLSFQQHFSKAMIAPLRQLLQNDSPTNRINGARLLAKLGRLPSGDVGDFLVEVLQDQNQNEGVKFYALQGLKEWFAAGRPTPLEREKRCIKAVVDFLNSKINLTETMSPGQEDGVRYIRREAIRALGNSRVPTLGKDAPTALLLLRILVKDGITPAPSLSEQMEAANGLCQLQSKLAPEYQPDYAAFFIGKFLVDFLTRANEDRTVERPREAWKYQAMRLIKSLDSLKTDTAERAPVNKYIADLCNQLLPMLGNVQGGGGVVDPNNFIQWLNKNTPQSPSLFKGDDRSVVKPAEG